ncbi:class I SAM-dependent methyltransferase [Candidatus Nitrospira salsa]|nr:MAG: hypothetical protein NPIRA01_04610 [Nitrospirales bacterium]
MNYRDRLYQSYISTHFGTIREISAEACSKQCPTFRAYFKPHLPQSLQAKILDVGCGFGGFLFFLRQEGYENVHGVEISHEQVNAANSLGIPNVFAGDLIEYLHARPAAFDCITALDVLEHFRKDETLPLLDAIFQALKPSGRIVVQVPNGGSPFSGTLRYGDFTHEMAFTKTSIQQVLHCSGFSEIAVHAADPFIHGPVSAIRWGIWQILCLILRGYQAVETGNYRGHIFSQNLLSVGVKNH